MNDLEVRIKDFRKYKWKGKFIYSKPLDSLKYKVNATIAIGTLYFFPGVGTSISARVTLSSISEDEQLVNIRTRVRLEYFFISAIFLVFILVPTEFDLAAQIGTIGMWLVFLLWFHLLYRVQENILINKTVRLLQLEAERK